MTWPIPTLIAIVLTGSLAGTATAQVSSGTVPVRAGDRIWITSTDGREWHGDVTNVSAGTIKLRLADRTLDVPMTEVSRIETTDSVMDGVRRGGIAGALGGLGIGVQIARECESGPSCPFIVPGIFAAIGFGVGALAGAIVDGNHEDRQVVFERSATAVVPVISLRNASTAPRLAFGGGFAGASFGALPFLTARKNLTPLAALDFKALARRTPGGGVSGFYVVQLHQRLGRTRQTAHAFGTLGMAGQFVSVRDPERRVAISTGDVFVYPAHTYRAVTAPGALTVGGGVTLFPHAWAKVDLEGTVLFGEPFLKLFSVGVTVPLGHRR